MVWQKLGCSKKSALSDAQKKSAATSNTECVSDFIWTLSLRSKKNLATDAGNFPLKVEFTTKLSRNEGFPATSFFLKNGRKAGQRL